MERTPGRKRERTCCGEGKKWANEGQKQIIPERGLVCEIQISMVWQKPKVKFHEYVVVCSKEPMAVKTTSWENLSEVKMCWFVVNFFINQRHFKTSHFTWRPSLKQRKCQSL